MWPICGKFSSETPTWGETRNLFTLPDRRNYENLITDDEKEGQTAQHSILTSRNHNCDILKICVRLKMPRVRQFDRLSVSLRRVSYRRASSAADPLSQLRIAAPISVSVYWNISVMLPTLWPIVELVEPNLVKNWLRHGSISLESIRVSRSLTLRSWTIRFYIRVHELLISWWDGRMLTVDPDC